MCLDAQQPGNCDKSWKKKITFSQRNSNIRKITGGTFALNMNSVGMCFPSLLKNNNSSFYYLQI